MNLIKNTSLAMLFAGLVSGCTADTDKVEQQAKNNSKTITTTIGKPSAPITMDYVISKENIKVGDEFSIDLSFQSRSNSAISIKANSFKKLTLLSPQKNWQASMMKSGKREVLPKLNFVATENGVFYIKLMTSVIQDGKTMFKPFVVPVVVGDGAIHLEPVGVVVTDDKGQKVLIQKGDSSN